MALLIVRFSGNSFGTRNKNDFSICDRTGMLHFIQIKPKRNLCTMVTFFSPDRSENPAVPVLAREIGTDSGNRVNGDARAMCCW